MKNSYLIIIIFATLCANYSFGQSNKSPDNKDVFNAVANDNINILISEYTLKQHDVNDLKFYDNIQGNPYLPKNFTEGVININDKNIRTFFRYNMHTDEVEFKIKDLILILTEIPEETRIDMEDNTLIYLTY